MKLSFTIFTLILFTATTTLAQVVYEPQILILAPNKTKYDKVFTKEIQSRNKELKQLSKDSKLARAVDPQSIREMDSNIRISVQSAFKFYTSMDFFKYTSELIHEYLMYHFYERFPNLLIRLKDTRCNGEIQELRKQSTLENLQYVVNIRSIELYKSNAVSYAKITIQLYDNTTDSLLIDKEYIGDWNNPGFEFGCETGSIDCTINNAMSQALSEILYTISLRSPTLQRERQLAQERFDKLVYTYLPQPFDKQAISRIISPLDTTINLTHVFQSYFSPDSSKFVSFFLQKVASQDFKALHNNKQDKSVNIITSKQITDEGYLDDIPQTYAYIVNGVKYNGKWYYEKTNATYFEAKNEEEGKQKFFNILQQFDFFKENTSEYSNNFWEGSLFEKIVDLRKDPDWDKYGQSMWKYREREKRPYIGLYEIVASELRKEHEDQRDEHEKSFYNKYLKPLLHSINAQATFNFKPITKFSNDFLLIYPTNFKTVLCPVNVQQNGKSVYLRYFVFLQQPDSTYRSFEWKYLKPTDFKNSADGPDFMKQINTLTEWDYTLDSLDDEKFWNDYVLAKSGDSYVYLKEIK